jgi:hypothetical protein
MIEDQTIMNNLSFRNRLMALLLHRLCDRMRASRGRILSIVQSHQLHEQIEQLDLQFQQLLQHSGGTDDYQKRGPEDGEDSPSNARATALLELPVSASSNDSSSSKKTTKILNLPDDILLMAIMPFLGARTCMRLTYVCRAWAVVMADPAFVSTFLRRVIVVPPAIWDEVRKIESNEIAGLVTGPSGIEGTGAFATRELVSDEPLMIIDGDVVFDEVLAESDKHSFQLGYKNESDVVLSPFPYTGVDKRSVAHYINHSCDPNLTVGKMAIYQIQRLMEGFIGTKPLPRWWSSIKEYWPERSKWIQRLLEYSGTRDKQLTDDNNCLLFVQVMENRTVPLATEATISYTGPTESAVPAFDICCYNEKTLIFNFGDMACHCSALPHPHSMAG